VAVQLDWLLPTGARVQAAPGAKLPPPDEKVTVPAGTAGAAVVAASDTVAVQVAGCVTATLDGRHATTV
jgi:hypothetical protein